MTFSLRWCPVSISSRDQALERTLSWVNSLNNMSVRGLDIPALVVVGKDAATQASNLDAAEQSAKAGGNCAAPLASGAVSNNQCLTVRRDDARGKL